MSKTKAVTSIEVPLPGNEGMWDALYIMEHLPDYLSYLESTLNTLAIAAAEDGDDMTSNSYSSLQMLVGYYAAMAKTAFELMREEENKAKEVA